MPVVDDAQFAQFQACFEPKVQRELLKTFVKETQDDIAQLAHDPRHRSHRIKGRAAQLGFLDLQHAAHALQIHCDAHRENAQRRDMRSDCGPAIELATLIEAVEFAASEALSHVEKLLGN